MECPVCGRSFPPATINAHVNECLNSSQDSPEPVADDTSSAATAVPQKRKCTDWGSLQPMRSEKLKTVSSPGPAKKMRNSTTADEKMEVSKGGPNATVSSDGHLEKPDDAGDGNRHIPAAATNIASTRNRSSAQGQPPTQTSTAQSFAPLAERMRPQGLEDYVGQDKAVGQGSMLYSLLSSDHIPSIILWGPPGCGKTSLAKIIANNCRSRGSAKFVSLSAAVCGVNEVKDTIRAARTDQKMFRKKTVLFLDEIHRFNKTQQDILLPHVEDGTVTLIGATTENPSFQVNSALLSRCRVIVLEKLTGESIVSILQRALPHVGATLVESEKDITNGSDMNSNSPQVFIDHKALELLANLVDGDARAALNGLQMAVQSKGADPASQTGRVTKPGSSKGRSRSRTSRMVTTEDVKEGLQRSHVVYDKTGDEHYNIISALHKSMRGSDDSAALYWLARMLEGGENPLYIARRLIRFASEDVGLADPLALNQAVAAYQGCHLIGMPECDVLLAQCVVYLSRAPKSVEVYKAYGKAKSCYGKDYKYNPDYEEPVNQTYFPDELVGTDFFS
ncbi:hypothetical protein BaRGS_00003042 [Batillaria attramentaria]|uniref:UBZ4-type domain-containing protein n=1 Tax=Batillaria attramentaria TaxID=370345 RepID=A0ABD0M385_9CAEN